MGAQPDHGDREWVTECRDGVPFAGRQRPGLVDDRNGPGQRIVVGDDIAEIRGACEFEYLSDGVRTGRPGRHSDHRGFHR